MESIYDRINRELKARKMTRRELAARAGINESTLGSLFHRKSEYFPTKYTKAIAKVFDMPWEDLAGYVREITIGKCIDESPRSTMNDALFLIRLLKNAHDRYTAQFGDMLDMLKTTCMDFNGKENCTNCAYGDGIGGEKTYCYDCRWYDARNKKIKWVDGAKEG